MNAATAPTIRLRVLPCDLRDGVPGLEIAAFVLDDGAGILRWTDLDGQVWRCDVREGEDAAPQTERLLAVLRRVRETTGRDPAVEWWGPTKVYVLDTRSDEQRGAWNALLAQRHAIDHELNRLADEARRPWQEAAR